MFDNQFAAFDVQALSIEEDLQEHDYFVKELKDLNERLQPWVRGEKAETGEGKSYLSADKQHLRFGHYDIVGLHTIFNPCSSRINPRTVRVKIFLKARDP